MFGQIRPAVKNLLTVANSWLADQTYTTQRKAISAATVQTSASQIWEGSAWSSGTSVSIPVAYKAFTQGVSANPGYGRWKVQYSLNNSAYADALTWDAKGAGAGSKSLFTMTGYAKVASDNASTVDTLLTLDINSSGSTNHIGHTYGTTIRSAWSSNSSGSTEWKTAGGSPTHSFYIGSSITSQTMVMQLYSGGVYSSYSGYFGQKVTAGSTDLSVQTTLSAYGSFAVKGVLVNSSSYTLADTETFVYCDPSNANFCTGTPTTVCSSLSSEGTCNAKSAVGCSWFAGTSCSGATGTDQSTCESQGAGCTWGSASCSGADNTDQSTCEAQDDSYGGSCSWDTSTCPSYTSTATCQAEAGCTANTNDCSTFNGGSQGTCEGNTGCAWTGADCHAFDGTDQSTCETSHTGCTWDGGSNVCNGVYDESSVCSGSYFIDCSGNLCNGDYNTGDCTGTFGATCQGTAACSNLSDDGQTACNAESGCTWTVGITVTLPLTSNALRTTTGRIYSIVHVGSTGTCSIQGQTGENIFQYGNMTLFKKGDKVLLHNQNISYPCSVFSSSTPCSAQSGCSWIPVITCSSYNGDQSGCETSPVASYCSWNSEDSTCSGAGNATAFCSGNYTTSDRWFAHSLERGLNYQAKTANYTLTDIDDIVDCTSGTFTLTLPSASLNNGKQYVLKNTGSGVITLNTTSSQTIDGNASGTLTLNTSESMTVVSNNSNWVIV
jgi:hypothetical protein